MSLRWKVRLLAVILMAVTIVAAMARGGTLDWLYNQQAPELHRVEPPPAPPPPPSPGEPPEEIKSAGRAALYDLEHWQVFPRFVLWSLAVGLSLLLGSFFLPRARTVRGRA